MKGTGAGDEAVRQERADARAFCAREPLSEPSFYAWRRVIRQRDAEALEPAFVRVVADDAAEAQGHRSADIEIEVRGVGLRACVVRLPTALPMRQVAELVHAIAAAGGGPKSEAQA